MHGDLSFRPTRIGATQREVQACRTATAREQGRRRRTLSPDGLDEHDDEPLPRSRRMFTKRPHSLLDLKDAGPFSPPLVPPRSPLRPTSLRSTDTPMPSPSDSPSSVVRPHSFGSLTALLDSLAADQSSFDKELPLPPGFEDDLPHNDHILEDIDDESSSSSDDLARELGVPIDPTTSPPLDTASASTNQPAIMTKRMHALEELLSSERAYASDLALIRDIHIPLALGKSLRCVFHSTASHAPI